MHTRPLIWLACTVAVIALGGCSILRSGGGRPTATQIGRMLPQGSTVDEIAYADLTADGRDEVLVAATVPGPSGRQPTAFVFAPGRGGRYAPALRRSVPGQGWLPIQVGRPGSNAPLVGVFAAPQGSRGYLGYIVVQQHDGVLQATLERFGLLAGQVRFVPEGLLESQGDVDVVYRRAESGWQSEELPNQYLPALPPDTVTVSYTIDEIRGPMIDSPRSIRVRVGQHLYLRRFGRGDPSRIFFSGARSSYKVGSDGVIEFLQPDQVEIHIEGPAYRGRTITILVRVEP